MNHGNRPDLCLAIADRIDSWLDGDLSPSETAELTAHLAACAVCREELRLAQRLRDTLRAMPVERCPDTVVDRVYARIAPSRPGWRERIGAALWRPALAGALAAALLLATALVGQREPGVGSLAAYDAIKAEREARWALAYVGLLGERAGQTLRERVIDERVIVPVVRTLEKSLDRDESSTKREVRDAG